MADRTEVADAGFTVWFAFVFGVWETHLKCDTSKIHSLHKLALVLLAVGKEGARPKPNVCAVEILLSTLWVALDSVQHEVSIEWAIK